MFFNKTKTQRSTTRPTLSTEALEPRAMFSVTAMPVVETTVSDQFDVGPVHRAAEVNHVETYGTGYCVAGGTGFIKLGDIKGELRLTQNLGGTSGPGGTSFLTGDDGRSIVHPQYNVGVDGRSIVHPQYNLTGSAGRGGDDIFRPNPVSRGLSLHDSVHCFSGSHASSGRVGVWTNGNATSIRARQDVGHAGADAEGFIKLGDIKGEFQLTQRLGGSATPGGDDVFMPKPLNVSMYDHMQAPVENVSMYDHVKAPRYRAFALMGR